MYEWKNKEMKNKNRKKGKNEEESESQVEREPDCERAFSIFDVKKKKISVVLKKLNVH